MKNSSGLRKRIGVFAGTFDPVHAGHIAFALQALQAASLDRLIFMPERRPRGKDQVEHFGHRVAMLKNALKPHPQFEVYESVDMNFSVKRTVPQLKVYYPNADFVYIFGSDVIDSVADWPYAKSLINNGEFVIGLRENADRESIHKIVENWPVEPKTVTIFESYAPGVSSNKIREALRSKKDTAGILKSVERYSDRHWLYVSVA